MLTIVFCVHLKKKKSDLFQRCIGKMKNGTLPRTLLFPVAQNDVPDSNYNKRLVMSGLVRIVNYRYIGLLLPDAVFGRDAELQLLQDALRTSEQDSAVALIVRDSCCCFVVMTTVFLCLLFLAWSVGNWQNSNRRRVAAREKVENVQRQILAAGRQWRIADSRGNLWLARRNVVAQHSSCSFRFVVLAARASIDVVVCL
jgi:hypothetical protein